MKRFAPIAYTLVLLVVIVIIWGISSRENQLFNMVVVLIVGLFGGFGALWRHLEKLQSTIEDIEIRIIEVESRLSSAKAEYE